MVQYNFFPVHHSNGYLQHQKENKIMIQVWVEAAEPEKNLTECYQDHYFTH